MNKMLISAQVWLATRKKAQKGQSLAEYGLILALIAVFCIAALTTLGGSISQMLQKLAGDIAGAGGG